MYSRGQADGPSPAVGHSAIRLLTARQGRVKLGQTALQASRFVCQMLDCRMSARDRCLVRLLRPGYSSPWPIEGLMNGYGQPLASLHHARPVERAYQYACVVSAQDSSLSIECLRVAASRRQKCRTGCTSMRYGTVFARLLVEYVSGIDLCNFDGQSGLRKYLYLIISSWQALPTFSWNPACI